MVPGTNTGKMVVGPARTVAAARHGVKKASAKRSPPPYPKRQLLILALCRICEPIAFMSIFPYVYHMVKDFNITNDESKISMYAGWVTSSFTLAEFLAGFLWGRLSDKIGRKPVLLTGMGGTGLSVILFGFAPSLPIALLARALGGILNGNMGVLQTTVGELVTVKEHQPRAYTVMPIVWCIGSIVGPMIGGTLARPVDWIPTVFQPGSVWDRFPYLLPNLFSALCVFFGLAVGFLFLEETHAEKKYRRDRGVEFGKYLTSRLFGKDSIFRKRVRRGKNGEEQPLLGETYESLPGYRTADGSPELTSVEGPMMQESPLDLESTGEIAEAQPEKPERTFTKPIIFIIINYGLLAFHTMTLDSLLPVFLSTEPQGSQDSWSLPFKFADGFGYDTRTVGIILSIQGLYSMISTSFFFPRITGRIGALRLFQIISISYPLLYFATPYFVLLPSSVRMAGVYLLIVWKCTLATMAYPSNAILLTNSAPSTLTLGTINGVAASIASLCRAMGPIVSGYLYTVGLRMGYCGIVWWFTAFVTIGASFLSFGITEPRGRLDEKEEIEEPAAEDAAAIEPAATTEAVNPPRSSTWPQQ
ncbi:major facilitator superfamily domain-containing protein [Pseudoneurospora amorphoporcata]|uniref:Major facilitator superfamily domain-containing protein n=1 Tax=Pseudoneurospora amorphoporcata TaxID=241081 RepID=A0AAN6SI83_9PEZI|nr:major facilitator superfamily domain-containing protein [Pseudoneurospora amorphoporcata]